MQCRPRRPLPLLDDADLLHTLLAYLYKTAAHGATLLAVGATHARARAALEAFARCTVQRVRIDIGARVSLQSAKTYRRRGRLPLPADTPIAIRASDEHMHAPEGNKRFCVPVAISAHLPPDNPPLKAAYVFVDDLSTPVIDVKIDGLLRVVLLRVGGLDVQIDEQLRHTSVVAKIPLLALARGGSVSIKDALQLVDMSVSLQRLQRRDGTHTPPSLGPPWVDYDQLCEAHCGLLCLQVSVACPCSWCSWHDANFTKHKRQRLFSVALGEANNVAKLACMLSAARAQLADAS